VTAPLVSVVFDHTALLTLGAGNRLLSGLIAQAHAQPGRYVYVPALCVVAAAAARPELANHLGVLPAVRIIELDYPAAADVGGFIASGVDWRSAHAIDASRPTADWPMGRPVVTTTPEVYTGWGVKTITIG
jgi:hypothetical protein